MLKNNGQSVLVLLKEIKEVSLYQKLIIQLNKDFQLAGLSYHQKITIFPKELVNSMHIIIYKLLSNQFEEFLKLLYIIDVSESEIRKINQPNAKILSEKITYIIIKREWQKVYFRNKFKN